MSMEFGACSCQNLGGMIVHRGCLGNRLFIVVRPGRMNVWRDVLISLGCHKLSEVHEMPPEYGCFVAVEFLATLQEEIDHTEVLLECLRLVAGNVDPLYPRKPLIAWRADNRDWLFVGVTEYHLDAWGHVLEAFGFTRCTSVGDKGRVLLRRNEDHAVPTILWKREDQPQPRNAEILTRVLNQVDGIDTLRPRRDRRLFW